jgi:hypothetical protein
MFFKLLTNIFNLLSNRGGQVLVLTEDITVNKRWDMTWTIYFT